ncbi:MAG: flavin-dependent trigonelline monooxygenase, oxygenase component [Actinomycetota bacterium]|jgi:alkanesulfonate monooxygenase SsuD/methylene tetrahydromethanopterin reductase-like flavin-dependent oxidoreductase (luciferase family)|nr:flavin-dependent trigonelline monooxygenase, oxygenase component [Actinomycetota bacterium]
MRFAITIDLGRMSPDESMAEIADQALELAIVADQGGFDMIFAPEHHAIEMTIGPNPFIQLANWAPHLKRARLGPAVLSVPYWHPIRLAGEAALFDVLTSGRLELGLGRGAYQYEFDRMGGGIAPERARELLAEAVPLIKRLWAGECENDNEPFPFPTATACPKPLQEPRPPIWIAARHPAVFDLAVEQECDVMATPLGWPFAEVESLAERLEAAVAGHPGARRPRFMVLRDTFVYADPDERITPVHDMYERSQRFQTLFLNSGGVKDGFPEPADLSEDADSTPEAIWENHVFGTPDQVIAKLRRYEDVGVDFFLYGSSALNHEEARRSLELFINEVMPAFEAEKPAAAWAP